MKILVTGSNGQLGKTFQCNNVGLNNYIFYSKKNLNFLDKDKIISVLNKTNPQIIINCAAYTSVDDAENNENIASAVNFEAVEIISNWCKDNCSFLIHFSTDYVFDGKKEEPYIETDLPNPLSVYGKTKYLGEQAFLKSNCPGVCLRTSWVHSSYGKNFFLTMKNLVKKNQIVKIINDQFGIPTTTNFLVKISESVIQQNIHKQDLPKILHAVPSGFSSWYDFGNLIFKNLKKNNNIKCKELLPIKSIEFKQIAKRPKFSVLSNKNLIKYINIEINSWIEEHKLIKY